MTDLDLLGLALVDDARAVFAKLADLPEDDRIEAINAIRTALHEHSPMRHEPVDCVLWVPAETVQANTYNPNVVAPPEMQLLTQSISVDGYTQPIVTWPVGPEEHEVVDGFHRHRVGKDNESIRARGRGRLPITAINPDRADESDRRAATIRHNRARGQHTVEGMADIVVDLRRRGKSDEWIGRELGMDPDEVLRLRQTSSIAEAFADGDFNEAWRVES
jgi:ParB-like chromosome segregation protein Spo0J